MILDSHLYKICQHYSLGQPRQPLKKISGGLLHEVYQLVTYQGAYAIKCIDETLQSINSNILSSEKSQAVACYMQKQTIPTVVALSQNNHFTFSIEAKTYMVIPWVEGTVLPPHEIKLSMTHVIGKWLAKIHQVNFKDQLLPPQWIGRTEKEWQRLLHPLKKINLEIVDQLNNDLPKLVSWSRQALLASNWLQKELIFSHRDLDNRNVLWQSPDKLFILDWEYAGFIHPTLDLLIVALNWSEVISGKIDHKKFQAVVAGFFETWSHSASCVRFTPLTSQVFTGYMGYCLDWIAYNLVNFKNNTHAATQIQQTLTALYAVENSQMQLAVEFNCVFGT